MNLINFGDPRLFTYHALFISIRFGLTFNLMPTKKCEHVTTETMNDVNTVSTKISLTVMFVLWSQMTQMHGACTL